MEDTMPTPKSAASLFPGMERFSVAVQQEHEYEHYINLTAKLIDRPYFTVHCMVKTWPLERIKRHYDIATKHHGDITPSHKWWTLRKQLATNAARTD